MFQIRTYGKAELALLYQPCSTPETAHLLDTGSSGYREAFRRAVTGSF